MNDSKLQKIGLGLRNAFHAACPDLAESLESLRKSEHYRRIVREKGFVLPLPPFVKRSVLRRFAIDHKCRTLVETGTQYGDTPWSFRNDMEEIFTIELSPVLASIARARFRKFPHIQIVEGDSGAKLVEILPRLRSKTLFWLDGHYSAGITAQGALDCPIFAELEGLFTGCKVPFIVLIDDARCFGRDKDYPTLETLSDFVQRSLPGAKFGVEHDIISIVPPGQ